jgi:hypothetical protein
MEIVDPTTWDPDSIISGEIVPAPRSVPSRARAPRVRAPRMPRLPAVRLPAVSFDWARPFVVDEELHRPQTIVQGLLPALAVATPLFGALVFMWYWMFPYAVILIVLVLALAGGVFRAIANRFRS